MLDGRKEDYKQTRYSDDSYSDDDFVLNPLLCKIKNKDWYKPETKGKRYV